MMETKIVASSKQRQCICGSQLPEGCGPNRIYCDGCNGQRNRDYWTRYSHSRTPISYPCAGGCGTVLTFPHDRMGRPPKYCDPCRATISQQRHRNGKRPSGKMEGGPPIELSPEQKQPFLAAFQELPEIARRTLSYWIEQVIEPSHSVESRNSRLLVRDFASEAFQVNETQFKAAMLAGGYRPVDSDQEHWTFYIQKKHPDHQRRYGMAQHDPVFSRFIEAVDAYFERNSIS
jgi:hypothetical protein